MKNEIKEETGSLENSIALLRLRMNTYDDANDEVIKILVAALQQISGDIHNLTEEMNKLKGEKK